LLWWAIGQWKACRLQFQPSPGLGRDKFSVKSHWRKKRFGFFRRMAETKILT